MKLVICLFLLTSSSVFAQTKELLQGLWNSSWVEDVPAMENADAAFNQVYHNHDLYFEGDSLWFLEFPCKNLGKINYKITDFKLRGDSILIYSGEEFHRRRSDSYVINILKSHALNPECYLGAWRLVRSKSGGDGTGANFIYAFEMPDKIEFTETNFDGKVLRLTIDGKVREFYIEMEREFLSYWVVLKPTESWEKKDTMMWLRYWDLPDPTNEELEEIKHSEGIPLKMKFLSSSE